MPAREIECVMPPGIGKGLRVIVTVVDQQSELSAEGSGAASYASPAILSVLPDEGVDTEGGLITIIGREFALQEWAVHGIRKPRATSKSKVWDPMLISLFFHNPILGTLKPCFDLLDPEFLKN